MQNQNVLQENIKEILARLVSTFGQISSWKLSNKISNDNAYAKSRNGLFRGATGDSVIDVNDFKDWSWELL